MILAVLAVAGLGGLAMAPGLLLVRGRADAPGVTCAAMVGSLAVMLLATALAGAAAGAAGAALPAASLAAVSLVAAGFAWRLGGRAGTEKGGPRFALPEWQGLAVGLMIALYGLASLALAFTETAEGTLRIHAWYNADWFKHVGHVHALANAGVPARDIFGGGGTLHYYWLFYILPGAAASLGAEPWAALSAANGLVSLLLGYCLYALTRMTLGPAGSANAALAVTTTALVVLAPAGFFFWFAGGGRLADFLASGISPSASGLLATGQVIPQHALATAVLCSWALLAQPAPGGTAAHGRGAALHLLSLAALASLMTLSTMLGAMLLGAYGLARLAEGRLRTVPELAAMVAASIAMVLLLEVLKLGDPASAIASPLLTDEAVVRPPWELAFAALMKSVGFVGLPLLVIAFFLLRLRPETPAERHAYIVSLALLAAGALVVMAAQVVLPARPAAEIMVRAKIPFSIAAMMLGAMMVRRLWAGSLRQRAGLVAALGALAAAALPSTVAFLAWLGNFGDVYTTDVPGPDRRILASLRERSDSGALVWQYPEKPVLGQPAGADNWTAIFAGRTVPNSERATDYAAAEPMIALSTAWFAGENVAIPGEVDWVYLSRALHPESYDALAARMARDPTFAKAECYEGACLFERRANSKP